MKWLVKPLGAGLLLLFTLPGCTAALIDEAERIQVRQHRVAEVTQAWVTADERLVVCARGWLANSVHSIEPEEYHFAVPLRPVGAPAAQPQDMPAETVPARHVGAAYESAERGCPEQPADAAGVEIAAIPSGAPGRPMPDDGDLSDADWLADGAGRKLWVMPEKAEPAAAGETDIPATTGRAGGPNAPEEIGPAVMPRRELPDAAILYRHDDAIFGGSRLAWVDPGESAGRQRGLYAFLPVTLALDLPVILFLGLIDDYPF
jgi:hypothetical protein